MDVERGGDELRVTLTHDETRLLRRALERASFMDTPASEQAEIARFCDTLLEKLASTHDRSERA